jgi:hypothetical protein
MFLNGHFHIESCKFTKMSIGVRIFSSENWSNLENTIKVTAKCHLLVELGALGEASFLTEVFEGENVGTTFGSSTDHLWGMDLDEVFLEHEISVESADT